MSCYDNIWEISQEEHSLAFSNLYYQPWRQSCEHPFPLIDDDCKDNPATIDLHLEIANLTTESQPMLRLNAQRQEQHLILMKTNSMLSLRQQKKRRKKLKPSPYHNFQKHLNTTLRHILTFHPVPENSPTSVLIAQRLWRIFLKSQISTKKILSFIFNEFNEYQIKPKELKDFGFEDVYASCSKEIIRQAKVFLTKMAIQQMNEENIDDYLETRRIKNSEMFKKYLRLFHNELQDGFLKKRFTNRSRKQQMLQELTKASA